MDICYCTLVLYVKPDGNRLCEDKVPLTRLLLLASGASARSRIYQRICVLLNRLKISLHNLRLRTQHASRISKLSATRKSKFYSGNYGELD